MDPAVLLWDFGDTLADERWMQRSPDAYPSWPDAWAEVMGVHANDWNNGSIGATGVFSALAQRTGLPVVDVESHARRCCEQIEFNTNAWRVAGERRCPQALVTVNPDIFGRWIVPRHCLTATFDTIVISSVERTNDKNELCDIALARLHHTSGRSQALLIDNRIDLIEAWRSAGGAGYWFESDERFASDLARLLH